MKKLIAIICALFVTTAIAQAVTETVYLKNGSIIKGEILEQIPDETLKIRLKDGSVFVYDMDEVIRITKEDDADNPNYQPHRGLDFSVNTGVNIATEGGGVSVPVNLMLSKRFSPNLSLGLGAGIDIGTTEGSKPMIPIFADAKYFIPVTPKLTPFVNVQAGYAINTSGKVKVGKNDWIETPDNIMFTIMPGVRFPLSHSVDLDFGIGYTHYVPVKDGGGSGSVAIKLGFNFHKSNNPIRMAKEEIPTRNKGFEFGLEGSGLTPYSANLLLGYKLSPQFSFALGVGGGITVYRPNDLVVTEFKLMDGIEEILEVDTKKFDASPAYITTANAFLRGQYRLTDKKFSPIASVDFGFNFVKGDGYDENDDVWSKWHNSKDFPPKGGTYFFTRPMVGISWRTTNNSYLEMKVGYSFTGSIEGLSTEEKITRDKYRRTEFKDKNLSNFAVSITWKRTFGLF